MSGDEDTLSQIFSALANPTRRVILERLVDGEATVNELAATVNADEDTSLSLPAISKHIKVLERAGLIQQGIKKQYRPCTIDVTPLQEVSQWTDQYRHLWEERFNRMDDYLNQLNHKEQDNE